MKKIHIAFAVIFSFAIFPIFHCKNVSVCPTGCEFTDITAALNSLINSTTFLLTDQQNIITIEAFDPSFPYYFTSDTINGPHDSSLVINYPSAPQIFGNTSVCHSLPLIILTNHSYISMQSIGSLLISGVHIKYQKVTDGNQLVNITNITFDNICFDSIDSAASATAPIPMAFQNIDNFVFSNSIFKYDQQKQIMITCATTFNMTSLYVDVSGKVYDKLTNAFTVDGANCEKETQLLADGIKFLCTKQKGVCMPTFFQTTNLTFVSLTNVEFTNCNFSQYASVGVGAIFVVQGTPTVVISNVMINGIYFGSGVQQQIFYVSDVENGVFSNYSLKETHITGTGGNSNQILSISLEEVGEVKLNVSNWTVQRSSFADTNNAILVIFYGEFEDSYLHLDTIHVSNTKFLTGAMLVSIQTPQPLSDSIKDQILPFTLTNFNVINSSCVKGHIISLVSTYPMITAVETARCYVQNATFRNVSLSQGSIFHAEGFLVSVTEVQADHITLTSAHIFTSSETLSSLFLVNSTFSNILASSSSAIASYGMATPRMFHVEVSYRKASDTVYAETKPFIVSGCTFHNSSFSSSSTVFVSKSPMTAIFNHSLANISFYSASFVELGGYRNMISSNSTFYSLKRLRLHPDPPKRSTNFIRFRAAEEFMFQNLPECLQLFQTVRRIVHQVDPMNSVYFIIVKDNTFSGTTTISEVDHFYGFKSFDINNGSIFTDNNHIVEEIKFFPGDFFSVFKGYSVKRATFGSYSVNSGLEIQGYMVYLKSDTIENITIDSFSAVNSTQLGSVSIESSRCKHITVQNAEFHDLRLNRIFFSIKCNSIQGNITVQNSTFQNITQIQEVSSTLKPITFFTILSDDPLGDNITGRVTIKDTLFRKNVFGKTDRFARGMFANSMFSFVAGDSYISFQNVTMEQVKIVSEGAIIMFSAPKISLESSNFTNLTYVGSESAFNVLSVQFHMQNSLVSFCHGTKFDGMGVLRLAHPDLGKGTLTAIIENSRFEDNKASFASVLYSDVSGVQMNVTNSSFSRNNNFGLFDDNGPIFFANNQREVSVTILNTNFTVSENENQPSRSILVIQNSYNQTDVKLFNCTLIGNTNREGRLIDLLGNANTKLTIDGLIYRSLDAFLSNSFGIFSSNRPLEAEIKNINVSKIRFSGPLFVFNCEKQGEWNILFAKSTFQTLIMEAASILEIKAGSSLNGALDGFSIEISDCGFSNITLTGNRSSIIKSSTALIGKYPSIHQNNNIEPLAHEYALKIVNCVIANSSSQFSPVFFLGHEPIFGPAVLHLENNRIENITYFGSFGGFISLSLMDLSIAGNMSNTHTDFSINSSNTPTIFLQNNKLKDFYSLGGGFISISPLEFATKMSSISLKSNLIQNIRTQRDGGIIYYAVLSLAGAPKGSPFFIFVRKLLEEPSMAYINFENNTIVGVEVQNGGILFEQTPNNTLSVILQGNTFADISAKARGGVLFLRDTALRIENNNFLNTTAAIAGDIVYSLSSLRNSTALVNANNILPSSNLTSLFSFGPTNLKVEFVSMDTSIPLELYGYSNYALNPLIPNLTSYSLSQFSIYFTLIYIAEDGVPVTVIDETANGNVTMEYWSQGIKQIVSGRCKNSKCVILPSENKLSGHANSLVLVNVTYQSSLYTQFQQFKIHLRKCIPGEINRTYISQCEPCAPGTYSTSPYDHQCKECPYGAICSKAGVIFIKPGFYRSPNISDLYVIPCNDSATRCLGGFENNCSKQFRGPICVQCNSESGYVPAGSKKCSRCSETRTLLIAGSLLFAGTIAYQIVMIIITYQGNKSMHQRSSPHQSQKPETGAYMLIFSSFAQISSIIVHFDVGTAQYLLHVSVSVGNPNANVLFSLKCLYSLSSSDPFKAFVFEILLYVFSPIVKVTVYVIVDFIFTHLFCKDESGHRKRNFFIRIGAVATVLIILEQPSIIGLLCSSFNCVKLDPYMNNYYLSSNPSVQCFTEQYNALRKILVIPALVFWGFLIPLIIFLILWKNRRRIFTSEPLRIVFGNFYNYYTEKSYYWGVIIMNFKVIIFMLNSVMNSTDIFKGVVFMCLFHLYYQLYKRNPPYKHKSLNRAEKMGCLAYMVVLTVIFLKMTVENVAIKRICDILIFMTIVVVGGYILLGILLSKSDEILALYDKLKFKRIRAQRKKQIFDTLKSYHKQQGSHKDKFSRRMGMRVELPQRYFSVEIFNC